MALRLGAHLGHMWQDMPLVDRIYRAADTGFEGVDIPLPYDQPAKELQRALLRAGVTLVSIAAPPPNYTGGVRGFVARPGAGRRFQHDLRRALRCAEALGTPMIHLLAGPASSEPRFPETAEQIASTIIANLREVSDAGNHGTLLLGASPDTALDDPVRAVEILREVDDPAIRLRLDLNDAYALGADAAALARDSSCLGHVAVTYGPSRSCPAADDPVLAGFLAALRDAGYDGWISAAYPVSAAETEPAPWRGLI
jgi:hydroxypyruvate isomerase